MHIHFVCKGNTFRSKTAESYARKIIKYNELDNVEVSSSGCKAKNNWNGPVTWIALRLIKNNKLLPFLKLGWIQTSQEIINSVDFIVFMHSNVEELCKTKFKIGNEYVVWDISDIDLPMGTLEEDYEGMLKSEDIFDKIKSNVDALFEQF